ncbi:hypothetical protein Ccrd_025750 [Cynara cardunculus var. scolymus]|uniref:Uncharacterized protein n=1 Tax=Cynara cardunculus var. scolymus TaxID=59895 RepID=A0A103UWN9_CYNCS|nr:hypothetical protein Ccrd_025750 [Cynara cardunculus var. scolymus]
MLDIIGAMNDLFMIPYEEEEEVYENGVKPRDIDLVMTKVGVSSIAIDVLHWDSRHTMMLPRQFGSQASGLALGLTGPGARMTQMALVRSVHELRWTV